VLNYSYKLSPVHVRAILFIMGYYYVVFFPLVIIISINRGYGSVVRYDLASNVFTDEPTTKYNQLQVIIDD
jgi:hypothetical protein